ncbi:hypothetical protein DEE24_12185, partial [Neisseria gonorrhoeae]
PPLKRFKQPPPPVIPDGFFYLGWSSVFFGFKNKSGYCSFIRAGIPRFDQLKTHWGLFPVFRPISA